MTTAVSAQLDLSTLYNSGTILWVVAITAFLLVDGVVVFLVLRGRRTRTNDEQNR